MALIDVGAVGAHTGPIGRIPVMGRGHEELMLALPLPAVGHFG